MRLNLITAPAAEPVTIADFEGQARIGNGTVAALGETSTVNLIISAIRQRAEANTRRALITQTWELMLDRFPLHRRSIEIPLPPLVSVDSITYVDPSGQTVILDPACYRVVSTTGPTAQPAEVFPAFGQDWPAVLNDVAVVTIRFTAGYGDDPATVPEGIRQWMLLNIASLYENREAQTVASGRLTEIDLSTLADSLLTDFRVSGW